MTTETMVRPGRAAPDTPVGQVTFARVLASEWIKFRTLRSSWPPRSRARG